MVQLRNKYEDEVQHRNARGIQLIERNEEVCIFYEKVNIQGTVCARQEFSSFDDFRHLYGY